MTAAYIPVELRKQVRADAGQRCGYCRSPEWLMGEPLVFEHLIPRAAGGTTARANLWLACGRCNEFKGDRTLAIDSETGEAVRLFNPRTQRWHDHFQWSRDGLRVIGLTPNGRATIDALRLNNDYVVEARRYWTDAGWHPPGD